MSDEKLSSGAGYFLNDDGEWEIKNIPNDVLKNSKYSGYLTINGVKCSVFDSHDGKQWAQKTIDKVSSKVASVWNRPLLDEEKSDLLKLSESEGVDLNKLIEEFKSARMVSLGDETWSRLENTNSFNIKNIESARKVSKLSGDDVEPILQSLGNETSLPAPIVYQRDDGSVVLVCGNARLIAAKAMKITPKVIFMSNADRKKSRVSTLFDLAVRTAFYDK